MAITLADAKQNTQDDVSFEVIDEFQKQDAFLDALTFDDTAVPGAGGGTLTYGWTMLQSENAAAGPRQFNQPSAKGEAKRVRKSADLIPFSAAYELDRILANLGPAATSEVVLQSSQAIKSVRASVNDAVINGATNTDHTFEGLDGLLAGSDTALDEVDWTSVTGEDAAHDAIDSLEALLSMLDGDPAFILANRQGKQRLRSIARRAGYYARERDEFGRQVESYAGVPFMDLGAKAASSTPVIPTTDGLTHLYVVRLGLDGFHMAAMAGSPLVQSWLPEFGTAGAVKEGEVEFSPIAPVLKATKAAAVMPVRLEAAAP